MTKKKVLLITFEFPPYIGGAGVYAHDTAIGLSKNECEVDVVTYHRPGIEKIQAKLKSTYNINVITFRPLAFLHFIQFSRLIEKQLRKVDYHLIILSDSSSKKVASLFGFLLSIDYTKTVCIFHGNEINAFFKTPSLALRLVRINKVFFSLLKKVNKIITVSKNEYNLWEKEYPELSSKLQLVKHGISEDIFFKRSETEKEKLKHNLKFPSNKRILCSASRLVKSKGQDVLIKAFSQLHPKSKNMLMLFAGDGPYLEDLKALAADLGVSDEVIFLGSLDREQLSQYYAISEVFILVSRFEEAFGLVYIEASACGIPSIAGNRGGVTDVVIDDVNGYSIDPKNTEELKTKLEKLLGDKDLYNRLANTAYQLYTENYTCKQSAKRLLEAYIN